MEREAEGESQVKHLFEREAEEQRKRRRLIERGAVADFEAETRGELQEMAWQ